MQYLSLSKYQAFFVEQTNSDYFLYKCWKRSNS